MGAGVHWAGGSPRAEYDLVQQQALGALPGAVNFEPGVQGLRIGWTADS